MAPVALFDLDNTLVDRQAAFQSWAQWFVAERQLESDDVEWLVAADQDGHASRGGLFAEFRARRGLSDSVDGLITAYEHDYPLFFEPDLAASRALARLRAQGWRLAIVTNGAALQRIKIARAGLADLVDACSVSAELGMAKPDPRIFEHAVAACGGGVGALHAAWMTGDSPEHDMAGARALGIRTIWMHRDRTWSAPDFEPDHRARSIPDAVDIITNPTPGGH